MVIDVVGLGCSFSIFVGFLLGNRQIKLEEPVAPVWSKLSPPMAAAGCATMSL